MELRTSVLPLGIAMGYCMSRCSEFGIPNVSSNFWPILSNLAFRIPNFCPWNRQDNSKGRRSKFGIQWLWLWNSELLPLKFPWQWRFHGEKFGI